MAAWSNWTGDQRCVPAVIVRPASEEELATAVRDAVARGLGERLAFEGVVRLVEAGPMASASTPVAAADRGGYRR